MCFCRFRKSGCATRKDRAREICGKEGRGEREDQSDATRLVSAYDLTVASVAQLVRAVDS